MAHWYYCRWRAIPNRNESTSRHNRVTFRRTVRCGQETVLLDLLFSLYGIENHVVRLTTACLAQPDIPLDHSGMITIQKYLNPELDLAAFVFTPL